MKLIKCQTKLRHEKERMEKGWKERSLTSVRARATGQRVRFGSFQPADGVSEATTPGGWPRERLTSERGRRPGGRPN